MSPFLPRNSKTYKGRFHDEAGRRYTRSLGTRNKREAGLVEAWGQQLRERRDWRTLGAVITGRIPAIVAYYAAQDGTLAEALATIDAQHDRAAEANLDALATEWARSARSEKYVRQVRTLIPEHVRFPVSRFTRATISKHLASLDVSDPTRNRYRVAFSQFARWLVEREVIPANPVRDVRGFKERDPRMVFYDRAETARLSDALLPFHRAAEAFMWGAGLEVSAVLGLCREDINRETREVVARGQKTRWRTRTVRVTEDAAWALITHYLDHVILLPRAPLFHGLTERQLLAAHQEACTLARVARSTLHDWRHTYAIQALRDGLPPQTVKRQLGHSPHSTMLERVYAAWIPATDEDYRPRLATDLATSKQKQPVRRGAK